MKILFGFIRLCGLSVSLIVCIVLIVLLLCFFGRKCILCSLMLCLFV